MLEKTGKHRFISPRRNFLSYIVPLIRTVSLTQVRSCVSTPNQSWDWVSPRPWAHPWNEVNLPELNISKDSDWVATNLTPGRGKRESKHNRIQSEEMEIFQGPQRFYVNSSNIMALWTPASIFWFIKLKRCIWYNTLAGRYHLSNKLSIPLKKKNKTFPWHYMFSSFYMLWFTKHKLYSLKVYKPVVLGVYTEFYNHHHTSI